MLQLQRLAQHLRLMSNQTVVWVDANPMTHAAHGALALDCALGVNAAAHEQARQLGLLLFSRQSMVLSGQQVDEQGHYPMHQPDHVVKQEVDLMAAWLSCMLRPD